MEDMGGSLIIELAIDEPEDIEGEFEFEHERQQAERVRKCVERENRRWENVEGEGDEEGVRSSRWIFKFRA